MKRLTATLCLTIAVLSGSVGVSESADFQKGFAAYESGDYATTLREWTPLAKQGDANIQNPLGMRHRQRLGGPKLSNSTPERKNHDIYL